MSPSGCRIVLVRTHYPGNLGATARVMGNFGLTDLVLVDPVASVHSLEARRMARQGRSVLDLAQAVAICCYKLHRLAAHHQPDSLARVGDVAPFADQERMFDHLRQALEAAGYLYGTKAEPLMHAIRHLIGRSQPTPQEVKQLH